MGYTAFYFGVDFVSGAISSIIMGMTPLINVLLAHLLASNDKLNGYKIVSLIISLAGLLLIVGMGSDGEPLDWKGITGIILLLLSIIFSGLFRHLPYPEESAQGQPYLPECRADVFRWRPYLRHRDWARKVITLSSASLPDFISAWASSYLFPSLHSASGLWRCKAKAQKSATSICELPLSTRFSELY